MTTTTTTTTTPTTTTIQPPNTNPTTTQQHLNNTVTENPTTTQQQLNTTANKKAGDRSAWMRLQGGGRPLCMDAVKLPDKQTNVSMHSSPILTSGTTATN
jgi:hypothetical protein